MSAMTIITLVFGGLLNLVGFFGFYFSRPAQPIALLPCALGLLLIACAWISTDPKLHRQAMKGVSFIALFGFVTYITSFQDLLHILKKISVANQSDIIAGSATALLCFILLARCFQEFLVTRSKKKDGEKVC